MRALVLLFRRLRAHVLEEAARVASAVLAERGDVPHSRHESRRCCTSPARRGSTSGPPGPPAPGSTDGAGSPALQLLAARSAGGAAGIRAQSRGCAARRPRSRAESRAARSRSELAAARVNVLGTRRAPVNRRLSVVTPAARRALGSRPEPHRLRGLVRVEPHELLHAGEKALLPPHFAVRQGGASRRSASPDRCKARARRGSVATYTAAARWSTSPIVSVSVPGRPGTLRPACSAVRDYALRASRQKAGGLAAAPRGATPVYFASPAEGADNGGFARRSGRRG